MDPMGTNRSNSLTPPKNLRGKGRQKIDPLPFGFFGVLSELNVMFVLDGVRRFFKIHLQNVQHLPIFTIRIN